MKRLKIKEIISTSATDPSRPASNLISGVGKWTTPRLSNKNGACDPLIKCEIRLENKSRITGIDVGNFWSASIEIQVGNSDDRSCSRSVLMRSKILLSRIESAGLGNLGDKNSGESVRFFETNDFVSEVASKSWDLVVVTCSQPFKIPHESFGLAMLIIRGLSLEKESGPSSPSTNIGTFISKVESQVRKTHTSNFPEKRNVEISEKRKEFRQIVRRFLTGIDTKLLNTSEEAAIRSFYEEQPRFLPTKDQDRELRILVKDFFEKNTGKKKEPELMESIKKRKKPPIEDRIPSNKMVKKSAEKKFNFKSRQSSTRHDRSSKNKNNNDDDDDEVVILERDGFDPLRSDPSSKNDNVILKSNSFDPSIFNTKSKEEWLLRGILVQSRIYKRDKDLPCKGGFEVPVTAGTPVTFYKKGKSEIFMEIDNKFYRPDVQEEHIPSVFKNFSEEQIAISATLSEETLEETSGTSASHKCPICKEAEFPCLVTLEAHVWICDSGSRNPKPSSSSVICPICSRTFYESGELETHAVQCASEAFD